MFAETLKVAVRNVFRHRARSAVALAAIGFGVVALLLAGGFIEWILWDMRESTIEQRLGHIQTVRPGFMAEGRADPFNYLLPQTHPAYQALNRHPRVDAVTPRLFFSGLISQGETTVSFLGEGVAPATEAKVSRRVHIRAGQGLAADQSGLVLGEGLAEALGARPGDTIVLLATTDAGGFNAVETTVRGIFYTFTKAYDDVTLRLPIDTARQLLRVEGAHAWVALLASTEDTDTVVTQLRREFAQAQLNFVPWHALSDFYLKTKRLFERQVNVVWILIGLIIVLGISNTLVMSVMERRREIGTLLALGFRRAAVLRIFVLEGALLGALGGLGGIAVGWALAALISAVGIPMPPPPGMAVGFTGEIRLTGSLVVGALVVAVVTTMAASLYPAWKGSRLVIVDALRHNQ